MAMKGKHHLTCMCLNGGRILRYRGRPKETGPMGRAPLRQTRGQEGKEADARRGAGLGSSAVEWRRVKQQICAVSKKGVLLQQRKYIPSIGGFGSREGRGRVSCLEHQTYYLTDDDGHVKKEADVSAQI